MIVREDGSFAAKCWHDDDATWHDFKRALRWDDHVRAIEKDMGVALSPAPTRRRPRVSSGIG